MSFDQQRLELVRRYVDGAATAEETKALESELGTDAAFRRLFLRYTNVDAALGNGRLSGVAVGLPAPVAQRPMRWLSRRPAIAAAVGLVFGLFCASVAWAMIGTRVTGARINVPLLDESFENPQMKWLEGFPAQAGSWSGDRGQVICGTDELTPRDGKFILRLDPSAATALSYLDRVIDLQSQPMPEGDELRQIQVTASFHAATPGVCERYTLRVATFAESPEQIGPLWVNVPWREMDQRTLTLAKHGLSTPTDANGWQTMTVTVEVPREARSVVISLASGRLKSSDEKSPHFLDDVRAHLLIGPRATHSRTRRP
jgi:hypothetical protein